MKFHIGDYVRWHWNNKGKPKLWMHGIVLAIRFDGIHIVPVNTQSDKCEVLLDHSGFCRLPSVWMKERIEFIRALTIEEMLTHENPCVRSLGKNYKELCGQD